MATRLLLRTFLNERLTAAAEEIFQVFEGTFAKYEEEASSSKQEIERLRGLLESVSAQKTDFCQSSICEEETLPEQHRCKQEPSLSVCQGDSEPRYIKEEDQELWAGQQQGEEGPLQEFNTDLSYPPHSSSCEQGDAKPPLQPQTQNGESEGQFQQLEETKIVHLVLPLASTPASQALFQNETVQDGQENERPAESLTSDQTQTQQSQSSFIASTELSHFNSVAPDCHLCGKSFSSNHHLINHAFRFHSNDADIVCAVCGQTLESAESLDVHLKSHKGSKCCHVCGKRCKSTTILTEHMAGHAGVKLHRCHVCGKECSRKGDLKIHMRIHTGEKPFCCTYCHKSFTHSGHLRKHLRSHTGERPHRCDVCGRGFLQRAHLKYHLGTHAQKY